MDSMRAATRVTAKAGTPRPAAGLHWPEYLIEAALLATFLVVAMCAVALIEHPASPLHAALPDQRVRRIAIAIAMGVTVIAIVYSPWGKRSGAHVNPAVTLTFLRLGRIAPRDALAYVVAQCAGAIVGTVAAIALLGQTIAGHPAVGYVQTRPGPWGNVPALLAEGAISFGLMLAVLVVSNDRRIGRWTGVVAAILVAAYISVESPISGTSMNPARSLGPALAAGREQEMGVPGSGRRAGIRPHHPSLARSIRARGPGPAPCPPAVAVRRPLP